MVADITTASFKILFIRMFDDFNQKQRRDLKNHIRANSNMPGITKLFCCKFDIR